jgi:hypothetical protein
MGTFRRGLAVSSASGAEASNPPKATTASPKVMKMFDAYVPEGQVNGAPESPPVPPWNTMARLMTSSTATSMR